MMPDKSSPTLSWMGENPIVSLVNNQKQKITFCCGLPKIDHEMCIFTRKKYGKLGSLSNLEVKGSQSFPRGPQQGPNHSRCFSTGGNCFGNAAGGGNTQDVSQLGAMYQRRGHNVAGEGFEVQWNHIFEG